MSVRNQLDDDIQIFLDQHDKENESKRPTLNLMLKDVPAEIVEPAEKISARGNAFYENFSCSSLIQLL
jgi:hypothetical protein